MSKVSKVFYAAGETVKYLVVGFVFLMGLAMPFLDGIGVLQTLR